MINLQPSLQNELISAVPLQQSHSERLYTADSDPLIWEEHPDRDRWQRNHFENYFKGAMESAGALLVMDDQTREIIGCSRYYDFDINKNSISIGHTFFVPSHWGRGYNYALKHLMLDHIFQFVNTVNFYIGARNKRSQILLERFGAVKTGEEEIAYYGEAPEPDFVYAITKENWGNNKGWIKE